MPEISKRCPRCGSEKKEHRDTSSRRETYKYMGEIKEYYVHTRTYHCSDCGLVYVQEEK